jgi:hypothetical protein
MNDTQLAVINRMHRDILAHDSHSTETTDRTEGYEYKKFEVCETTSEVFPDAPPLVFLYTDVGRVGDEKTLAAVLCRTQRHISIGPKGGTRLLNAASATKYEKKRPYLTKAPEGYWNCVHKRTVS